jgi:hypothetical protein
MLKKEAGADCRRALFAYVASVRSRAQRPTHRCAARSVRFSETYLIQMLELRTPISTEKRNSYHIVLILSCLGISCLCATTNALPKPTKFYTTTTLSPSLFLLDASLSGLGSLPGLDRPSTSSLPTISPSMLPKLPSSESLSMSSNIFAKR